MILIILKLDQNNKFQKISRNLLAKSRKIEILTSQSKLSDLNWVEIYPIHQNWSKSANIWEFPDFWKISGKIPEKLEFWNSDSTIMLSDLNWVGNIPKMTKLVQTSPFLGISRFPENFWQNSRKIEILQFWLHNHV